jgi:hypothetical protein
MRDIAFTEPISRGYAVTAKRGIAVLGEKVEMNNVSYFCYLYSFYSQKKLVL